jgi:hypothetical protein
VRLGTRGSSFRSDEPRVMPRDVARTAHEDAWALVRRIRTSYSLQPLYVKRRLQRRYVERTSSQAFSALCLESPLL